MRGLSMICFLVFLTLKLGGGVDWSWGYICLPAAWCLGMFNRQAEIEKALGRDLTNV